MNIRATLHMCLLTLIATPIAAYAQDQNTTSSEAATITVKANPQDLNTTSSEATTIAVGADIEDQNTTSSEATPSSVEANAEIEFPAEAEASTPNNPEVSPLGEHDLSPWGMYQAADVVVKSVMIGLLLASVVTWAVWIFKFVQLHRSRRQAKQLLTQLVNAESFSQSAVLTQSLKGDAVLLIEAGQHELTLSLNGPVSDKGLKERIVARLERVQASLAARMNQGTGILATVGSVAPFVGLFGTVWGIMNSFIGIAKTQTTNLAVVAPGIAEALLATALGLVAAIPAVMIYNYFARAIGGYRSQLADISTALMILVSRDLDRQHPSARTVSNHTFQATAPIREAS